MTRKTDEWFRHFMHYRRIIREALPKNPNPAAFGLDITTPAWFRSSLLFAAAHHGLLTGSGDGYREAYLSQKAEVIRAVQGQIDLVHSYDGPELWCMPVIACLVLNETIHQEFSNAEAHLRGLFTVLDLMDKRGPSNIRIYVELRYRCTLLHLSLLAAACDYLPRPRRGAKQIPTTRISWANVEYLYAHIVSEFFRNRPLSLPELRPGYNDARLSRWLLESVSNPDDTERWECRMAVAAYALTVGSLSRRAYAVDHYQQPGNTALEEEEEARAATLRTLNAWYEERIAAWVASKRPARAYDIMGSLLDKILWLETEGTEQQKVLKALVDTQAI